MELTDLPNMDEICCPDCGKPLAFSMLPNGHTRFDGCGRDCREVYDIPQGCELFGPKDGLKFVYKPKTAAA